MAKKGFDDLVTEAREWFKQAGVLKSKVKQVGDEFSTQAVSAYRKARNFYEMAAERAEAKKDFRSAKGVYLKAAEAAQNASDLLPENPVKRIESSIARNWTKRANEMDQKAKGFDVEEKKSGGFFKGLLGGLFGRKKDAA
jgi:hypothetical protein